VDRTAVLTANGSLPNATYNYTVRTTDNAGNTRTYSGSGYTVSIEKYAAVVGATAGLVSHWRLGETSGSAAADVKSTNAGTYNGSPLRSQTGAIAGDANKAIKLDGLDDHVAIPTSTSLGLADGPFTLEAWVRLSDANPGYQNIFNKGSGSWSMSFGTSATTWTLFKDAAGAIATANRPAGATTGFHHYVAVKSGTTTVLYVDGVAANGAVTNRTLINTGMPLMLGRNANTAAEYLRGWLDEAAIYNRALTAAQVLDHYRAGTGTG